MSRLAKMLEENILYTHDIWIRRAARTAPGAHARLRIGNYTNDLLTRLARERGDKTRSSVLSAFHGMRVVVDQNLCGFVVEEDTEVRPFQDLGWANGWEETPWIVEECQRLGHRPIERNLDPTMHGLDTEVRCEQCNYVYHCDSSD